MILLLFAVLAPLFSFRWRRFAALGGGIIAELFSLAPFGAMIALLFLIVFFVELLARHVLMRETAGWAIAALGALGIAAFGETVFAIVFDHVSFPLALALLISKIIVGAIVIGFLWTPVKLSITKP